MLLLFLTYIQHGTTRKDRKKKNKKHENRESWKWWRKMIMQYLFAPRHCCYFLEENFFIRKVKKEKIKNSMSEWKVNSTQAISTFADMIVNWSEKFSLFSHAMSSKHSKGTRISSLWVKIWIREEFFVGTSKEIQGWELSMQISSFQQAVTGKQAGISAVGKSQLEELSSHLAVTTNYIL